MPLTLTRTVDPTTEPVSLDEAKDHLRVTHTDEDQLIDGLIKLAREDVESFVGRALVTQTWQWILDGWPVVLCVPRPPLQSVTSITYLDENGDSQTWASSKYQVDTSSHPGRIIPVEGEVYPSLQGETLNRVTVTYVAGYGAASTVPQTFKQAMKLLVAQYYVQREPELVGMTSKRSLVSLDRLLYRERIVTFV